jgi:hypothetical protein
LTISLIKQKAVMQIFSNQSVAAVCFSVAGLFAGTTQAATTILLDFNAASACAGGCVNFSPISLNYGSTSQLAVDFSQPTGAAYWWGPGYYNGLNASAFLASAPGGGDQSLNSPMQIAFTAASGYKIEGISFVAGASSGVPLAYTGTSSSGNLFAFATAALNPNPSTFSHAFAPVSNVNLAFGPNNWNASIGYIALQVSAVPEPGEFAMLVAGLGVVSLVLKRRKTK